MDRDMVLINFHMTLNHIFQFIKKIKLIAYHMKIHQDYIIPDHVIISRNCGMKGRFFCC
ncbi:hypothetical protein JHK82_026810 [Glycine max]|uniref:Uncharacterized protein n=2 Tax=Glycine subgen. Soja TaxID=1462606 RepID=K7LH74_SOYBN|nr:hypothetical protein JHK87_026688 [Glycine soja]KAG4995995.1 hypothetical protein JHK85_027434 [Glycine max]KAG5002794.1 hypothetical protein JHK86_026933 [Glycine max]KAG5125975.1 hypothetical protein JHK82_026810 [Glycine max]KAG5150567.1 hypothetical protein JHK84_027039 [Glycine max]